MYIHRLMHVRILCLELTYTVPLKMYKFTTQTYVLHKDFQYFLPLVGPLSKRDSKDIQFLNYIKAAHLFTITLCGCDPLKTTVQFTH